MSFILDNPAHRRAQLLEHRFLRLLPAASFEVLLNKGEFLSLAEADFADHIILEDLVCHVFFVLEGRIGLYHPHSKMCLATLKDNEDFLSHSLVQGQQLVAFSPEILLYRVPVSVVDQVARERLQAQKSFALLSLSLGAYSFFKRFQVSPLGVPETILNAFVLETYETHEAILKQGDESDRFFILTQGGAKAVVESPEQGAEVVRTLEAGDYFGEVGLIQDSQRTASIIASSQVALFSLAKPHFLALLNNETLGPQIREVFQESTSMYSFKESHVIGSSASCSMRILDYKIAPQHIKIGKIQEQSGRFRYSVKPACDTNRYHTFVNKEPIYQEVILDRHDELVIGDYQVIIDPIEDRITLKKAFFHTLQAYRLSYRLKHTPIIDKVSFTLQSNQLIGLLGPSGSGKSTLLELLYGIKKPSAGKILFDQVLFNSKMSYSHYFGWVPQDDILFENLTVYENLFYEAKIRHPLDSLEKINSRIERVLDILKLTHKKDARIGSVQQKGLSGGQKKRVNIARELLFEPDILFLDEPISGLSSRDAEEVMSFLRILADMGKMVIVVLHQPSSKIYQMLDQTIVLDQGGKMVYVGPAHDCLSYMQEQTEEEAVPVVCPQCLHMQPDRIFQLLEKRDKDEKRVFPPDFWQQAFAKKEMPMMSPARTPTGDLLQEHQSSSDVQVIRFFDLRSHLAQLYYLIQRTWLIKVRDQASMLVLFLTPVLLAVLIAFIFRSHVDMLGDHYRVAENPLFPMYLFIAVIFSIFMGSTGSAKDIVGEQPLYLRESITNLKNTWYIGSKFLVQSFLVALQLGLFWTLSYWILGVEGVWGDFYLTLYLSALFGVSLGLLLSTLLKSTEAVINLIPLILIPQMILGGGLIPFEKMNPQFFINQEAPVVPEVAHFIPARWAYEALVVQGLPPRQDALSYLNTLRQDVLIERLEKEESDALVNQLYDVDDLIAQIEQKYPLKEQVFVNKALVELVKKGYQQSFRTQLDLGLKPMDLIQDYTSEQHALSPRSWGVDWALFAPKKQFFMGDKKWAIPTPLFNLWALALMALFNLILAYIILERRSYRRH